MSKFLNENRNRNYGLRVGDIVVEDVADIKRKGEVIELGNLDNNSAFIRTSDGSVVKVVCDLCEIIKKIEDK